ncbi:MAG: 6-phospho-beta-glucosidase [Clostridiales bacterium]|nr:6-phospho-beta-glucosidase [Clostridiales bacterium]
MKDRKLTILGAGSVYTPEIFAEIAARKDRLRFREIALVDIDEGRKEAELCASLAARMLKAHGLNARLTLTTDRREALSGSDFVVSQIRVGRMAARAEDEKLGMSLGLIGQETTGVGGFVNALRTIPTALSIARDMEEICPDAWLVNFTNPAGVVTEAVLKHSRVRCVGLCNVPINMVNDIAKVLGVPRDRVRCRFMGLNHLSFVTAAELDGLNVLPEVVEGISGNETLMKNIPKAEGVGALTKLLGIIPSPYLQYYWFEDQMRAKQADEWEKSGVSRAAQVGEINRGLFSKYADESVAEPPAELSGRGGSLYSFAALNVVEALSGEQPAELVVNARNRGAIEELRDDDVVEINCLVGPDGVRPLPAGRLPEKVSGLVQAVKQYERLTVRAAVEEDRELAISALLNHPLAHGFRNAEKAVDRAIGLFPQYIRLGGRR